MTIPYCTAPFHSFTVEPDKSVRPCTAWVDDPLGNLQTQNLNDILNSTQLKNLQQQMIQQTPPAGCSDCIHREENFGHSARTDICKPFIPYLNHNKITYIEFNGSNLCNLVCAMCEPAYSSAWYEFRKDIPWWREFRELNGWKNEERTHSMLVYRPSWDLHPPQVDFTKSFLDTVDFSMVNRLMLKGGEPMLNKENILLLEHLDKLKVLSNITILMITNGTYISDKLLELMKKAGKIVLVLSIDGLEKINQYIRYDPKNHEVSHTDNIKQNIFKYLESDNILIRIDPAVQAYNIHSLEKLRQWWYKDIYSNNTTKIAPYDYFKHFVRSPKELSISVLDETTRQTLANYYESIDSKCYRLVIDELRLPRVSKDIHQKFVKYTEALDRTRPDKFLDLVPEARDIMNY